MLPKASEEGLQIAVKRREAKNKGEKERYKHLNSQFQRIGRRDKKAFFSDQCKEIEEKNRMGKTRDLFKKIRDTKGILHANMDSLKERNGMDLRKRRYSEEVARLHRTIVQNDHNPDNHNGVITHLELAGMRSQVGLRKHHYKQS